MAEQNSPGQRDKAAAEVRTAEVGAENRQEKATQTRQARAAEKRQANQDGDPAERRNEIRADLAKADSAADKLQQAQDVDTDLAGEVALNPYPEYEEKSTAELRSAAEGRNVEINRDVEKAELIRLIRAKDPTNVALDFMTVEELRSLASEKDVELGDEFVKAHLVTELRAADTGVNNRGDHVL
jgi:hypothetical protein